MIILSWNIRGLNGKIKRSMIRSLINQHTPQFFFIQETKIEVFNQRLINSFWKNSCVEWISSPSQGNSGGIISLWRTDFFKVESTLCDKNWIAITGEIRSIGFGCTLINIYNPCTIAEREVVWQNIRAFQSASNLSCLIIGDFNEVLDMNDRGSQHISSTGS